MTMKKFTTIVILAIILILSIPLALLQGYQAGSTSAATNPQSYLCKNTQDCDDIDKAWKKIGNLIHSNYATKIWENGWRDRPTVGASFDFSGCPVYSGSTEAVGVPNGGTLNNGMQFPSDEPNAYVRNPAESYGTIELINVIAKASCVINQKYNVKMGVGDLSKLGGGPLSPHLSHTNGLDADLRIYTQENGGYETVGGSKCEVVNHFCKPGTVMPEFKNAIAVNWEFIKALQDAGDINFIIIDPELKKVLEEYGRQQNELEKYGQKFLTTAPGHHNHFHIRINCPADDARCQNRGDPDIGDSSERIATDIPSLDIYESYIQEAAGKFEVDPDLIKAVMYAENSDFDPNDISSSGCVGLMQVCFNSIDKDYIKLAVKCCEPEAGEDSLCSNEKTTGGYNCNPFNDERFDPEKNIMSGTSTLKNKMETIGNCGTDKTKAAIAAYNLGQTYVNNAITAIGNCNDWHSVLIELQSNANFNTNTLYGDAKDYNVQEKLSNLGKYVDKVYANYQSYQSSSTIT